ncbi:MAG: hypothetical protein WC551_01750 [Patescibacteria group bacterium]
MFNPNLPKGFNPEEQLKELGFTLGPDGILRGDEIVGCTIGLPDEKGVVLIKAPDGREFKVEGVKGVSIKKQTVSGKGSTGIVL